MADEKSAPEGTGFRQDDWKVDTLTQIAQQTVHNTYIAKTGETPSEADEKRHFFTVPFPRNADFVGREADLTNLHAALSGGDPADNRPVGILPAGLIGQGGMGKTALAVEYCHRHKADYPGGVFWINAAEPLAQGFASLGCLIDPANFDHPIPRQIDAAARYLHSNLDALLVLDNVEDPALLTRPVATDLIPTELACRVLFTTRRRDLPRRCRAVEVTVLPPDAALSLLLSQRNGVQATTGPEQKIAAEICAILGHLPLALEIAAAHLRRPRLSLAHYRQALLERGALAVVDDPKGKVSADDLTTRHTAAVAATLAEQWESLENEDARLLLRVAGQLPAAAQIPIARLGLLAGISDEEDIFGSPLELATTELENASLIEKLQADELRLHPLVREFAGAQTPTGERDKFRTACAENLHRAYSDFVTLESHCARRGVAALEADLASATELLTDTQSPFSQSLISLQRILERESHTLRSWEAERQPVHFAQQLRHRAVLDQEERLIAEAAARLTDLARPYLLLAWGRSRGSSELIRVLSGHADWVRSVAVTPDGRWAVSASHDRTLRVWDLQSGAEERVLRGHADAVNGVAVTPDGRRALSASLDRTLRIWDLESGAEEQVLSGHADGVRSVAVTPDGRRAVSASDDRTLRVWDLQSGAEERVLRGHSSRVESVAVTPDGRRAVSASYDRTLSVWDLESGAEERMLVGHKDAVHGVAVTPDGRRALSASLDCTLRVWDISTPLNAGLESGAEERVLAGHASYVLSVAVTPDGRRAVSASLDRTLRVWDLESGAEERVLAGNEDGVLSVAVTPDGRRAVSASLDRTLRVWDISTPLNAGLQSGAEERVLRGHSLRVELVAVTPDGRRAVSTSDDHTLSVWDLESGAEERVLRGHASGVNAVAVTPDGRRSVSASSDHTLRVWNLESGAEERVLSGHASGVNAVAVTPDGRRAVSASYDRTLRVWDLESGTEERVLTGHAETIWSVAVTPDGRRAVSASDDHTLRVWDLESGEELARIVLDGAVTAVAVAPNGTTIVAGGAGGNVYCLEYVE